MTESKREMLDARMVELKADRSNWEQTIRDIAEQLAMPVAFDAKSMRNRGEKRDAKVLNSKPLRAARTLEAGLMAGVTSPARDWFRLSVGDQRFEDSKAVRMWLDQCHDLIAADLQRSNFYGSLSNGLYPSLCRLGTGAMFMEDINGKVRFRPMPFGEYWLDVDDEGKVDTCFREIAMTVRQMVRKFGLDNCSENVRTAYKEKKLSTVFVVRHAIYPRDDFDPSKLGPDGMRWASCWWDPADPRKDSLLAEGGYHDFPVLAPRWGAAANDAYGRGPGWDARGDCRMLQHHELRYMTMLDKITNPPMRASGLVDEGSLLPGDNTFLQSVQGAMYEPAMDIPPAALAAVETRIDKLETRIAEVFYQHLWQMLVNDERAERPTATEVEAKRQEVALQLGPLLESLNNELLERVVEGMFALMVRYGRLPEPPQELQGQAVKIEFISIMHAMQQATGLVNLRTLMLEMIQIAQVRPDALDNLEVDVIVNELARIAGVRPDTILSKDEVAKVREIRAKHAMAQQEGAALVAATQGVKNLSGVDPAQLQDLASTLSPVAAAQGGALAGVRAA